ncbi:MAG: ArsR/SmtB family transcription factor [Acidimicrobiales bacterium]
MSGAQKSPRARPEAAVGSTTAERVVRQRPAAPRASTAKAVPARAERSAVGSAITPSVATRDLPDECCAVPGPPSRDVEVADDEQLAAMAKALGNPMRVRILRLLIQREACVTGELVVELPLAQSTISEHLRILREAGLVKGEIEGPRTSYCADRSRLASLRTAIDSL